VDIRGLFSLALGLFDIQFGLFRHVQRNVLFGWGAGGGGDGVRVRGSLPDFDGERAL